MAGLFLEGPTTTSARLDGQEDALRVQVHAGPERPETGSPLQENVARPFAHGLWEVVSIPHGSGARGLTRDRRSVVDEGALFDRAIGNSVQAPYRRTLVRDAGVPLLRLDGDHPFMAAHAHVLPRHLDVPFHDGALIGFPHPSTVLVVPIDGDRHPIAGARALQACLDGSAVSRQVHWWRPSGRELVRPAGALRPGHRADLRPVQVTARRGGVTVVADEEFARMCWRIGT